MSQANLEIVRRYFDAIIRRVDTRCENPCSFVGALGADDLDADARRVLDQLHPEVRWRNVLGLVFEGKLDCARAVDELMQASQYYSVTLDDIAVLGGDRILAVQEVGMRGQDSETGAALSVFSVMTLREGLITQVDEFLDRVEALEAVGLGD
jgi:ketosteroid isomerase-like protein